MTRPSDHDAGDILTYNSTLSDGNPLPGWLTFNPGTREYSGTATVTGTLNIKVTVMDIASHTAFDIFDLVITEEPLKTDINVSGLLNVYPVPACNLLNIQLGDIETGPVDIEIIDISGRILLIERFNNISKDYVIRINISNLSKGIYFISIK